MIETTRLLLRQWSAADLEPFVALNADPRVTEHLPTALSRRETEALVERIRAHWGEHRFGLWVVEVSGITSFAGTVGLTRVRFDAHFTPAVEVSWRLDPARWGQGYATEAARAAVRFGFDTVGLDEVVAITVPRNTRSRRVMERLGMVRDPRDDFEHPGLAPGHVLRPHVLYRLRRHNH